MENKDFGYKIMKNKKYVDKEISQKSKILCQTAVSMIKIWLSTV